MVEKSLNSNNHIDDVIKTSFSDDVINKAMSQNMLSKPRNNSVSFPIIIIKLISLSHIIYIEFMTE